MANYNTFIVVDCKSRKSILTTSSARKASGLLQPGFRIDVWNDNQKRETVYAKDSTKMMPYIEVERDYIRKKQARAEARNKERKRRRDLSGK